MKLGRFFDLSGGVRWDRSGTDYNLYQPAPPPPGGLVTATVPPINRVDEQPSYRAALVYKPSARGSVYFDYGTSFNPAAESLSLSIGLANASAAPEETFWIQSMIRDDGDRTLLFDLDSAIQRLAKESPDSAVGVKLTGVYHNLLRRWAENVEAWQTGIPQRVASVP